MGMPERRALRLAQRKDMNVLLDKHNAGALDMPVLWRVRMSKSIRAGRPLGGLSYHTITHAS